MAKRKAARRKANARKGRKATRTASKSIRRRSVKRRTRAAKPAAARKRAKPRRAKPAASSRRPARPRKQAIARLPGHGKVPQLDRERRVLRDDDIVPTPPSSLDMDRRGSAARSGRAELEENIRRHGSVSPGITGGDVDANWDTAYFTGDEAPGGDNPTPDQDVVEDIGKALGVEYNDNEELKASDKVTERDKHRWELDPASSEDYKDRD